MSEQELRYYYEAYAKALAMLQHPEKVTENEIAARINQIGNSIFNRLFCLAVWREVKLQKEKRPSMPQKQYKDAITDVWRFFKRYSDGNGSDAYWDSLVDEIYDIVNRYQHCTFINDLVIHVTLEIIEDRWRRKEGKPAKF